MCRTKVVEKLEAHFLCSVTKQCHLLVSAEKYSTAGHRPQMTIWRMRIACRVPKATNTRSEYAMLIAFSTTTMVARTCHNVTLYVQCLCCYQAVCLSSTHLMFFSTRLFIPSAIMSRPAMSKPASVARTSVTCSGSSTGMWYFFKPAISTYHHNSSEPRKPLLITAALSGVHQAVCVSAFRTTGRISLNLAPML